MVGCQSPQGLETHAGHGSVALTSSLSPASTIHQPNVGPMLGQQRGRWSNIGPTLV